MLFSAPRSSSWSRSTEDKRRNLSLIHISEPTRQKSTYEDGSGRSYLELFRRLCDVDLLHLDDLGAEKRTDWVLEQLYAIVDRRYEEQRSMVVTTNLEVEALEQQIGERTVSRLVEICGDPLPLYGDDQRYRLETDGSAPPPGPGQPS